MLQYSCHTFLHSALVGNQNKFSLNHYSVNVIFLKTEVSSSIMATFEVAKNQK